jgi:hypothetical protein
LFKPHPKRPPRTKNQRYESSALFDHEAWLGASHGPYRDVPSPVSRQDLSRGTARQVFPATTETKEEEPPTSQKKKKTSNGERGEAAAAEPPTPIQRDEAEPTLATPEKNAPPPLEADPIPEVHLPGTTVREKFHSCLNALRKENESVVGCPKILAPRQAIEQFLTAVVQSKGISGPNQSDPILHVCGAPGSGKSMTVERCTQCLHADFVKTCEEWEVPPKFCYLNCSHLQNRPKAEALRIALDQAGTTESNLRRGREDSNKATCVFILDEIDYLVSTDPFKEQRTRTEDFLHTILRWASSSEYMVGVVGISNSVENDKAERLKSLGFVSSLH